MIKYRTELFGLHILTRVHGSAVVKGVIPALFSTGILLVVVFAFTGTDENEENRITVHPYAIQVLIVFFTFLVTFRANFAYGRYWEGATAVHQMLSKWLDAGVNMAAYHYQCTQYNNVRPPSFGKHAKLKNVTREREREQAEKTREELKAELEASMESAKQQEKEQRERVYARLFHKGSMDQKTKITKERLKNMNLTAKSINARPKTSTPDYSITVPRRRGSIRDRISQRLLSPFDAKEETVEQEPSLFLQEMAHLLSLMSAVAMSTLRRDVEGIEPPLVEHIPGRPWPPVDPDQLSDEIRVQYHEDSKLWRAIYFLLGLSRSAGHRTLYNAARPFRVLGGVSDTEIEQLQQARGPYAKVALCSLWVQEFISREYLGGSTGRVAPPIISRVYQFVSDGMIGYNQCRKIAYVPFPFPHAQLTICFMAVIIWVFPLLFYSYVNNNVCAVVFNFITVLCFAGLHEVALELEAPFENAPNDIPTLTFQAQFNEALISMYAGFHPDSWWEIKDDEIKTEAPALVVELKHPANEETTQEEKEEEEEGPTTSDRIESEF